MRNVQDSIDTTNLAPLSRLDDFKVASGNQDVRGWDVIARDGKKIGDVDDLLVDTTARKVRYVSVDLDRGLMGALTGKAGGHVVIPIEDISFDSGNRVMLNSISSSETSSLQTYDYDSFSTNHNFQRSSGMGSGMGSGMATGMTGTTGMASDMTSETETGMHTGRTLDTEREARITLAEEELAVGKRQVTGGEVGVQKRVETQRVQESVPVMREEVTIESRPATGITAPEISADEIRVPVTHEEVIVEKRVVPTEELVIKKHQVQEQQTVQADVRRERAEVTHTGDATLVDKQPKNRR